MSKSAWHSELAPCAQRDLRGLDQKTMKRILDAIDRVVKHPDTATGARKLVGRPEFRLRVGERRVLFIRETQTRTIRILRVLPRGRAYDR